MTKVLSDTIKRVLPFLLFFYAFSLVTTMAGMEFASWLSFISVCLLVFLHRNDQPYSSYLRFWTFADFALIALFLVVVAGALINAPEESDKVFIIGRARWVFLFLMLKFLFLIEWDQKLERVLYFIFFIASIVSLNALFQHFTGIDIWRETNDSIEFTGSAKPYPAYRSIGFFGSAMTFGNSFSILLPIPCAFALFTPWKKASLKFFFMLATFLIGLAVFSTFTRGAWTAALVSVLFIAVLKNIRAFIVSVASIIVVIYLGTSYQPALMGRLTSIVYPTKSSSTLERINIWKANYAIFKDYPLFGIGYGENESVVDQYYHRIKVENGFIGHAHNNLFQFLSGTGIMGTVSYLAFCIYMLVLNISIWRRVRKKESWASAFALGTLGAQVALHVSGITECTFKDMEINHLLIFIFALLLVISYKIKNDPELKQLQPI